MVKLYSTLLLALGVFKTVFADTVSTSIISEVLRRSDEDNVIFSPVLVIDAIFQLWFGARDTTKLEIQKVLQLNSMHEKALLDPENLNPLSRNHKLVKMGDRLFAANDLNIFPDYQQMMSTRFNSTVENVDFTDSEKTVSKINEWVAEQTNNKIMELVDEVDADTKLMLISAIYFRGTWENIFDKDFTEKKPFHISKRNGDKGIVEVDTMMRVGNHRVKYIEKLDAHALELPYANSNIFMLVLLPKEVDGIDRLTESLGKMRLYQIRPFVSVETTRILLPKFKFEMKIELKEILQGLGIKELFNNANLQGMTDFAQPIAVTKFLQKAVIEVDEWGSEASAAQALELSLRHSIYNEFKVDHPFLFMITDGTTVYFAGRVSNLE